MGADDRRTRYCIPEILGGAGRRRRDGKAVGGYLPVIIYGENRLAHWNLVGDLEVDLAVVAGGGEWPVDAVEGRRHTVDRSRDIPQGERHVKIGRAHV